jgi:hypothetical protein
MTTILHVVGGVMLLCMPLSFVLTGCYRPTYEEQWGKMEILDFLLSWLFMYTYSLLFAAVGFAGPLGVAMLAGAFR